MMRKVMAIALALIVGVLVAVGSAGAASGGSSKPTTVHMAGNQEIPKGSPKGSGIFRYQLVPKSGLLCYSLTWSGIGTPSASHVHAGAKGSAGPVVIPLSTSAPVKQSGCVHVKKSLLAAIGKKASAYYVNVHTKKYPGGAIRGQL
jgi:hypothetical protein